MHSAPPPLPTPKPDWFMRNWKWLVPVFGTAVILSVLALVWGLLTAMRSTDVFRDAVARVAADSVVIEAVGEPVREAFWFTGKISVSGSSGRASFAIPVSGPRGKAAIHLVATKADGLWHYDRLLVVITANGRRIDLSDSKENR